MTEVKGIDIPVHAAQWEDLTLVAGTITFQCPFGAVNEDQLFLTITQKAVAAVAESFSWSISGSTITIDSSSGASTAVVRVKTEGYF